MPTENFDRKGIRGLTRISAVGIKGPQYILQPPNPGYWIPGEVRMETVTSNAVVTLTTRSRTSNRTPLFNSEKRPYLIPPQPFLFVKNEFSSEGVIRNWTVPTGAYDGPGSSTYEDSTSYYTNWVTYGLPTNTFSAMRSKAIELATRSLIKNVRDSSFNAAQAIAERKQTANLFASTATRVAGSLRNLRKGNFSGAARALGVLPKKRASRRFNSEYAVDQAKAIGNGWLELQYGWKPLLADVYGSMETIAKANAQGNPNTFIKRSTGRAKLQEAYNKTVKQSIGVGVKGNNDVIYNINFEVFVRTGVCYRISSPPLKSLASVGISNPLLLAWELVPYSFVVDWFLPIGNYLESLDATNGLTFESGYVTVLEKTAGTIFHTANTSQSGTRFYYANEMETYNNVRCQRTVLGSFPQMPYPTFKNPVSSSHVASALALLLQTIKK